MKEKKEYIKTLMNLYKDMDNANKRQKDKYEREKRCFINNNPNKHFRNGEQNFIYSDTMLHNLISIIGKIENNLQPFNTN